MDDLVARTKMRSRTEFIEQAIEEHVQTLREAKVVVLKSWTEAKARGAIVRYLRGKPSSYVGDMAEALGMDYELAFRVVRSLMEAGKIERAV